MSARTQRCWQATTTCSADPSTVSADGDGVVVHTRWSCAQQSGPLRYRSTVLVDTAPDARQVVLIRSGDKTFQDLLDASRTESALTEAPQPSTIQVVGLYLGAGIEHILIGYDHIAFLIAIVLWANRLWPVVKLVTAFTVGHSITLSLAALDIVRIPSSIIEPAIAASIVFVAAENFFSHDVQKRWRDTFSFGLVHGFGFASALQEFGIPKSALIPALASFNIGVEIGQIAIVAAVIPMLIAFDHLAPAAPFAALLRPVLRRRLCPLRGDRRPRRLLVPRSDSLPSLILVNLTRR